MASIPSPERVKRFLPILQGFADGRKVERLNGILGFPRVWAEVGDVGGIDLRDDPDRYRFKSPEPEPESATQDLYQVTIPITGDVSFEVRAGSSEEAEEKAWAMDAVKDGELRWEVLSRMNRDSLCLIPVPWSIKVKRLEEEDDS